jgi:hypothetical protein
LADKFVTVRKEHICDGCFEDSSPSPNYIIRKGERSLVSGKKYYCVKHLREAGFPENVIFGKKVKHQRQSNQPKGT